HDGAFDTRTLRATAIEDQYLPSPGQENYPETFTGCVLALIDKLDNMVSSFALGRISTGSEDPLGLRRQAQGFISILLNRRWYLSLREGIMWNLRILEEQGFMQYDSTLIEAIIQFLLNRFRFSLLESGYNYSVINAVLAVPTDDIYEVFLKVNALQKLLTEKKAFMEDIIVGYTRAKNITKNHDGDRPIDENLFIDEAERNLFLEVNQVGKEFFPAVKRGNYMEASEAFSLLLPSLHSFFEKVLVMCESEPVRTNRLSLVKKVVSFWSNVADLSQIVVQEEHR
ncbi:MAG: glycine--tRNA ligase subunit beta, partial [Atribacterota bacterium]